MYSILSPEGYASILWKDRSKASEAARLMEMTSVELYERKIVDKVFVEPKDLNRTNMDLLCLQLKEEIAVFLSKFNKKKEREILYERNKRFRKF